MKFFTLVLLWICPLGFAEIVVEDFAGRKVVLEQAARRVVALAPHITENIFAAGAGEFIVGAVDYCDYPEAAKSIPRVGAISAYSLESIIALKPDLVVLWFNGQGSLYLEKLVALGIPVYASKPQTLESVARSIRDYGRLMGTESIANKQADVFLETLDQLRQQHQGAESLSVFYEVWNDPLQTLNGDSIISKVIELCGAKNIFSDALSVAPKVSVESVIARDPQAIIASGMGQERPEWLDEWKQYNELRAVKNNNLFHIHPDLIQRHTPRILEGAKIMCQQLDLARRELAIKAKMLETLPDKELSDKVSSDKESPEKESLNK